VPTFRIVNWNTHYENNRTREMRNMSWVPIPVKLAGDGYTEMVEGKDGAAIYGAWVACVLVAASCDPRGTLLRGNGEPHDPRSLSRITRLPTPIIRKMLETAQLVGWIEDIRPPQEGAGIPQEGAPRVPSLESEESEEQNSILASPQASADRKNGEITERRFRAAWRDLFARFYGDYPRPGHRTAAEVKWMSRAPKFDAAAKKDPKGALRRRYGEFVDRLNEIVDDQAANIETGNRQYLPYADAFLNREFK